MTKGKKQMDGTERSHIEFQLFARLFQVILTDRGTEFSNPTRIEETGDGVKRTRVVGIEMK